LINLEFGVHGPGYPLQGSGERQHHVNAFQVADRLVHAGEKAANSRAQATVIADRIGDEGQSTARDGIADQARIKIEDTIAKALFGSRPPIM
jgi:hypothetical protein